MSAIPSNRKLQYILAVAQDLHFRKAAEKLHVSQPSLSRQVRECEEEFGFEIFRRDNHFVSLTKPAERLSKTSSRFCNSRKLTFRERLSVDKPSAGRSLLNGASLILRLLPCECAISR